MADDLSTQRAYTLRLQGTDPEDQSWRDALWMTHEAVNAGGRAFGDWLLTLRGGIAHELADTPVKGKKDITDELRKNRRILLALSWLSVESRRGAPDKFIVAGGEEPAGSRNEKVLQALKEILKRRGLSAEESESWMSDCRASLSAAIRDDAVWVNRSAAFDDAQVRIGASLTREDIWDMLDPFFGSREAYLTPAKKKKEDEDSSEGTGEEKAKDLVQKAGQWLSSRFGTGKGANFAAMAEVYSKISEWAGTAQEGVSGKEGIKNLADALAAFSPVSQNLEGVLKLISGPGYKSATRDLLGELDSLPVVSRDHLSALHEKAAEDTVKCKESTGTKGRRPYADAILNDVEKRCGFTYLTDSDNRSVSILDTSEFPSDYKWGTARHSEFAVILDHAARRISVAHSWIKLAEAERDRCEEDAAKVYDLPDKVKEWLDTFCSNRSDISGAQGEGYRIRRKAIEGWKEVVASWGRSSCITAEDRVAAARALQDDPEIDKFGDIQLFEILAQDEALCVWHKDGDVAKSPDAQMLIDYVLASDAESKKRRFKVPAYRHPDALLHPIFCDFGNSRWDITYDIHGARGKKKAKRGSKKEEAMPRGVAMKLWTGSDVLSVSLRWQSKKLAADLALDQEAEEVTDTAAVSRADRLGRAAAGIDRGAGVTIAGLFEEAHWNGRLQAPRQQLEAIAAVRDNQKLSSEERERRIAFMKDRIRWLVTFSAKLRPQGPWHSYAPTQGLQSDPKYWPHSEINKKRKGQAKLILSRLPGLRILSVDLGHRFAAACAVWETMSSEAIQEACRLANHQLPAPADLYLHLKRTVQKNLIDGEKTVEESTVYRRIGADRLPDGTAHPAPWARLDRQFLIKLQGEEKVREASNEEVWQVHLMESALGLSFPLIDRLVYAGWGGTEKQAARLEALREKGWKPTGTPADQDEEGGGYKPSLAVDELMFSAVRTLRLALKYHGDRARIAFALTADYKPMPGDTRYYFSEAKDRSSGADAAEREAKHKDYLLDMLLLWHDLAFSRKWRDEEAKELWNLHIAALPGYQAPAAPIQEEAGQGRKKAREEARAKMTPAAEALLADGTLREKLHGLWKERWEKDDAQWKKHLRWMKDGILPRGGRAATPSIRYVGGLSLTRLATLTEFRRKVQVGFYTRLFPSGEKREIKEAFGQTALDALERLREQRVKQLASRIAEAALGAGRVSRTALKQDPKRPEARVDAACHAVIIENLEHYRPEETRTRRENRGLMNWASSKVKKYLSEACQLHGLFLREVPAGYTSRQDSRTGAPGMRCQDVTVKTFLNSPFWQKQCVQAQKNKSTARDRFLCALKEAVAQGGMEEEKKMGPIRVPVPGGEVFVSADAASPAAKGLQADLNAAANIGLRALLDPDWPGKWWYVPCDRKTAYPAKEKVEGSAAVDVKQALPFVLPEEKENKGKTKGGKKGKGEVMNLWRDVSAEPLMTGQWLDYTAYRKEVENRVIQVLTAQLKARNPLRFGNLGDEEEIPY
ncbi:MAG TPA: type V CRISPR-associated protein Cas12b [Candidatus Hydrogenedentes bacterium]|nr:type V CRISPR-associated protein Cas12b [Candidatus Hydrogenedentota bacterium]